MTETLFALVSDYGAYAIGVSAYLSCLFLPVPTSMLMLAGGGFVAAGDLVAWQVFAIAYAAAMLGDNTGFLLGRRGSPILHRLAARGRRREAMVRRAQRVVDRHGGIGVFFSTWLVAPLGPYVNVVAGAAGLPWRRFLIWDALGELVWVAGYLSLGYAFAGELVAVAAFLSNSVGFLVAATLAAGLGAVLRGAMRRAAREA